MQVRQVIRQRVTTYILTAVFSPFDIVVVAQVVSLLLLLGVVQHHHGGVEVDDLSCGQQVEVGAAVAATVTVPGSRLS